MKGNKNNHMKIYFSTIKSIELNHNDIANLLSASVVDSDGYFSLGFKKKDYLSLPDFLRSDEDSVEDKAAKILLNKGAITITDLNAVGEIYRAADLKATLSPDDNVHYRVDLRAITDGLTNAANGDIIGGPDELRQCRDAFAAFWAENYDASDAVTLIQIILFNEIIYGC